MKTYIINLPQDKKRKEYMKHVLAPYIDTVFNTEFIEAVNGRMLEEKEKNKLFDNQKAFKRYGRKCRDGEIGCTLSHQKCYRKISESNYKYALILEDDIILNENNISTIKSIGDFIERSEKPTVILLSGGYWYTHAKAKVENHKLLSVFDAYYTFAYLINKKAAQCLITQPTDFLADDWILLKSKGIQLLGVQPHLINCVPEEKMQSTIFANGQKRGINKRQLSFVNYLKSYNRGGIRHLLAYLKRYEKNY